MNSARGARVALFALVGGLAGATLAADRKPGAPATQVLALHPAIVARVVAARAEQASEPALRASCDGSSDPIRPVAGLPVSITGMREILGVPTSGNLEAPIACLRIRTQDGLEGWIDARQLDIPLGHLPARVRFLVTPLHRAGETKLHLLLAGDLDRDGARGFDDARMTGDLLLALRSRQARAISWNGQEVELTVGGASWGGCALNLAVEVNASDVPSGAWLAVLSAVPVGSSAPLSEEIGVEPQELRPPATRLLEAWVDERVLAENPQSAGLRVDHCRWHRPLDIYRDGSIDLVGSCQMVGKDREEVALFWLEWKSNAWIPRMVRSTFYPDLEWGRGSYREAPVQFPDPFALVTTDLDRDGRMELWIHARVQTSEGSWSAWWLFLDTAGGVLGPFEIGQEDFGDC